MKSTGFYLWQKQRITRVRYTLKRWWRAAGRDWYLGKEDYLFDTTPEWFVKHLNATVLEEHASSLTGRVLDLGCHHGLSSLHLARQGKTVVGIDLNGRALLEADRFRRNEEESVRQRVHFIQGYLHDIPLRDGAFDSAIMFDVLEHIYQRDWKKVFGEITRVLKPSSRVLIIVPYGYFYDHPTHVSFFHRPEDLERALRDQGLSVEAITLDERKDLHGSEHKRINALARVGSGGRPASR